MFNRREMIVGGPVLLASTAIWTNGANAGLFGKIGKVVGTAVQVANVVTNPVKQIAIATQALKPLIHQVAPNADRALEMVNTLADQSSTLEGRLRIIVGAVAPQALPLLMNTDFSAAPMDMFSQYSAVPLAIGPSDEQALLADPSAYVTNNSDFLSDYVARRPFGLAASSFNMPAGGISLNGISAGQVPKPGYYPSVLSINDILTLVSIFRG